MPTGRPVTSGGEPGAWVTSCHSPPGAESATRCTVGPEAFAQPVAALMSEGPNRDGRLLTEGSPVRPAAVSLVMFLVSWAGVCRPVGDWTFSWTTIRL